MRYAKILSSASTVATLSSQSKIVEIADSKIISEIFAWSALPIVWLGSITILICKLFLTIINSLNSSWFKIIPTIWFLSSIFVNF